VETKVHRVKKKEGREKKGPEKTTMKEKDEGKKRGG